MFHKISLTSFVVLTTTGALLVAQESNTTPKPLQPLEARQPTKSTAPALRAKLPPDAPPRLSDPATDENGRPLAPTGLEDEDTRVAADVPVRRKNPDRVMATWIALDNLQIIAISDLASERSTDEAIKDYASTVAEEHADLQKLLKRYAPDVATDKYLNTTAKDARDISTPVRTNEKDDVDPNTTPLVPLDEVDPEIIAAKKPGPTRISAATNRDFDVVQIERELATQSLASSRKMLNERRGAEFDRHFLAHQIAMHKSLRDKLIVYQRHVSGPLADLMANAERTCEEQMLKATELATAMPATPLTSTTSPATRRPVRGLATE